MVQGSPVRDPQNQFHSDSGVLLGLLLAVACTDFLKGRGRKKEKTAHIVRPHHCRGHFRTRFGSQEGSLARVLGTLAAF